MDVYFAWGMVYCIEVGNQSICYKFCSLCFFLKLVCFSFQFIHKLSLSLLLPSLILLPSPPLPSIPFPSLLFPSTFSSVSSLSHFETGSCYIALASLEVAIFLPQSPKSWVCSMCHICLDTLFFFSFL